MMKMKGFLAASALLVATSVALGPVEAQTVGGSLGDRCIASFNSCGAVCPVDPNAPGYQRMQSGSGRLPDGSRRSGRPAATPLAARWRRATAQRA